MKYKNILEQKRDAVVRRWFALVVETYPADAAKFLRREKDQFANPVGHTTSRALGVLYDALLQGADISEDSAPLAEIIRIRAVQEFSASRAVGFVFLLKKAIRRELDSDIRGARLSAEQLLEIDSAIDRLALVSFDIYMKSREKIYELKANQVKNMALNLMKRSNLVSEMPDSDTEDNNKEAR